MSRISAILAFVLLAATGCPSTQPDPEPSCSDKWTTWRREEWSTLLAMGHDGSLLTLSDNSDGGHITLRATAPDGNLEWERTYPYSTITNRVGYWGWPAKSLGLFQTEDGGYLFGFGCLGSAHYYGILVAKLRPNRDIEWIKSFGGTVPGDWSSVCKANDGGYAIAGTSDISWDINACTTIRKLSAEGATEWAKRHQGYGRVFDITATEDGGYLVATEDHSEGSPILLKLNEMGNIESANPVQPDIDPEGTTTEMQLDLVSPLERGTFLIAGRCKLPDHRFRTFLAEYNSFGNLAWNRILENRRDGAEEGFRVISALEKQDGGWILTGNIHWSYSLYTALSSAMDVDDNGDIVSTSEFDNHLFVDCTSALWADDGGLFLAGTWGRLAKTDAGLNLCEYVDEPN